MLNSAAIKEQARAVGFDRCGIAAAADYPELRFFDEWLARGYDGQTAYLRRSAERRRDVRAVVPGARAVIATATVYNVDRPYSTERVDPAAAHIARYAWGEDYHDVIERRLDALLTWMRRESSEPFEARAYVDTGPVQERVYARYAGIGWIGKNSCVINPELGSWLFLAEIITTLALDSDEPAWDQCGTCTLCIEACPTDAITAPGALDSTRCISFLTIEQRGALTPAQGAMIGSHVYGCDICQEVCPWNHTAARSVDPAWHPRAAWDGVTLHELSARSDDELRGAMRGSAMRRTKIAGLRRNIAAALANTTAPSGGEVS